MVVESRHRGCWLLVILPVRPQSPLCRGGRVVARHHDNILLRIGEAIAVIPVILANIILRHGIRAEVLSSHKVSPEDGRLTRRGIHGGYLTIIRGERDAAGYILEAVACITIHTLFVLPLHHIIVDIVNTQAVGESEHIIAHVRLFLEVVNAENVLRIAKIRPLACSIAMIPLACKRGDKSRYLSIADYLHVVTYLSEVVIVTQGTGRGIVFHYILLPRHRREETAHHRLILRVYLQQRATRNLHGLDGWG